jgi:type IV pilus assembly protein PilE
MIALRRPTRQRGVTLMELMIVMVVVGILASVSIPAYRTYMMRINRTDAKRELMSVASTLERCFTRSGSYRRVNPLPDATPCVVFPRNTDAGTYQITPLGALGDTTYTLQATPTGGQADDAKCAVLTLTAASVQGTTGTLTAQQCWSGSGG